MGTIENKTVNKVVASARYFRVSFHLEYWLARIPALIPVTMAVLLPSIINPWGYNAFELPKVILLRGSMIVSGLILYLQLGTQPEYVRSRTTKRIPPTSILWPIFAFCLSIGFATIFSINRYVSLWGTYDRQQGLLTFITYVALFLITVYSLRSQEQVERLWHALVWGSMPVVIYGLIQMIGLDTINWQTSGASRVLSLLGRSNFLGSYLVLIIPLTIGLLLYKYSLPYVAACDSGNRLKLVRKNTFPASNEPDEAKLSGYQIGHALLLSLLIIGQVICLGATQARGAWMGFFIAMLMFGFLWGMIRRYRIVVIVTFLALITVTVFVLLLMLPNGPFTGLTQVKGFNRLSLLGNLRAGSTAARLTIWQEILPLVLKRPWFGYGPDTMRPVFDQVFPPHLVYYMGHNVVADRAHNVLLDTAMVSGLTGVIAYVWLILSLAWLAWSGLHRAQKSRQDIFWIAFIAAMSGHLIDMQFTFNVTATAALFWILLGLGFAQWALQKAPADSPRPASSRNVTRNPQPGGRFLWPVVASTCITAIVLCGLPLWADNVYRRAGNAQLSHAERSITAQKAVMLWPFEPEYRLGLVSALQAEDRFIEAEIQLNHIQSMLPADAQMWSRRGDLYVDWGRWDPSRYDHAVNAYRQATLLAPSIAHYHAQLGLILIEQGEQQLGVVELGKAAALDGQYQTIMYSPLPD